jgi:prephenate dehydrogenase
MKKVIIGIIGGTGKMGGWFQRFFSGNGQEVLISGRKTRLNYKDLAQKSDIVILSLPLDAAKQTAVEIGPLLKADQLLMDFCSLKEDILACMLRATPAQVCGTHPLFGPMSTSILNQNIVICKGRGTRWMNWLESQWESNEAVVTHMDSVSHDKHMAVVQGLNHLLTIGLGRTLQKMDMSPGEAFFYSTPVFRIKLDLIGRLFAQDLGLYQNLITQNRHVPAAIEAFVSAMKESRDHLVAGSTDQGRIYMEKIREFLGTACQKGLDDTNAMIKALYSG